MSTANRRSFLATTLTGLSAGPLALESWAAETERKAKTATTKPKASEPTPARAKELPAFDPAVFLTWQRDPTTTMTVQWIGVVGETADTNVKHRLVGTDNWTSSAPALKPYPLTDYKIFRTELTGLAPGRDYEFEIGKQSPTYRFVTMPAKATNAISFISGGDCGVNEHAIANNIQAARQEPMFAIVGGDLGYDDGRKVDISLAFIRNYARQMVGKDRRLIPIVPCIGNHEVDGGYNQPREKAPFFFALFDGLFKETSYATLDFGDYLSLVLLDTGHVSPIGGEQAAWLDRELQQRVDRQHLMVVNHVPAYPSYRKPVGDGAKEGTGEGNRKHWAPLFDKHRVPIVLEHHDHTFKRSKPMIDGKENANGVLYLGDGSWGRLRPPKSPEDLSYLALSAESYHLSLHRLQGDERFHLALGETGKVMDVCRTAQRTKSTPKT